MVIGKCRCERADALLVSSIPTADSSKPPAQADNSDAIFERTRFFLFHLSCKPYNQEVTESRRHGKQRFRECSRADNHGLHPTSFRASLLILISFRLPLSSSSRQVPYESSELL